jgi:hypothetical protein
LRAEHLGHGLDAHVAVLELPFVVGLEQHCADQPQDGSLYNVADLGSAVRRPLALPPAAASTGRERVGNAEHDLDLVVADLDAAHDGTDDLTAAVPVQPIEAGVDPLRKLLQAPDHQVQAALGLACGRRRIPFGAQAREPPRSCPIAWCRSDDSRRAGPPCQAGTADRLTAVVLLTAPMVSRVM